MKTTIYKLGQATPLGIKATAAIGLIASVLLMAGSYQLANSRNASAATCPGAAVEVNAPATGFADTVAGDAEGTCYHLNEGTYNFHNVIPKNNMKFIGHSRGDVQINGAGHENAFHGVADGVEIESMTFYGFNDKGIQWDGQPAGGGPQEQAPIRGTRAIWDSNAGDIATNWTINDVESYNNLAAGIFLGDDFTVTNSTFRDNGVTGIAGDSFTGGMIKGNTVHGNGDNGASGALVNSGGMKFTQAGDYDNELVIDGNTVYDNYKSGIWCDIACHGFKVINNNVYDHPNGGIYFEISDGAYIAGNTLENNAAGWDNMTTNWAGGGILVAESADVVVENNTVTGSRSGITVRQTKRPWGEWETGNLPNYEGVNFVTDSIVVRNNVVNGAKSFGVGNAAQGIGLIPNPSSIEFSCNTFDDTSGMTFYWVDDTRQTFAEWQAAGRDTGSDCSEETPVETTPVETTPPETGNPDTGGCSTDNPLSVELSSDVATEFTVWTRMKVQRNNDGSTLHAGLGDTCSNIPVGGANDTWTWVKASDKLDLNQGRQTVDLHLSSGEIWIDKLIFTVEDSCTPEGDGQNCILEELGLTLYGVDQNETYPSNNLVIYSEVTGLSSSGTVTFAVDGQQVPLITAQQGIYCLAEGTGNSQCGAIESLGLAAGERQVTVTAEDRGREVSLTRSFVLEVSEQVTEPEPTDPIVDPEPTDPIVEPEPTDPIVDPEPTEPVVDPEPTEQTPTIPEDDPVVEPIVEPDPTTIEQPLPTEEEVQPEEEVLPQDPDPSEEVELPTIILETGQPEDPEPISGEVVLTVEPGLIENPEATVSYTVDGVEVATSSAENPRVELDTRDLEDGEREIAATVIEPDGEETRIELDATVENSPVKKAINWLKGAAIPLVITIGTGSVFIYLLLKISKSIAAKKVADIHDPYVAASSGGTGVGSIIQPSNARYLVPVVAIVMVGLSGFVIGAQETAYSGNASISVEPEAAKTNAVHESNTEASTSIQYTRMVVGEPVPIETPPEEETPVEAPPEEEPVTTPTPTNPTNPGTTGDKNAGLEQFRNTAPSLDRYYNVHSDNLDFYALTTHVDQKDNGPGPGGQGQFRLGCHYSHLAYDDPIVYPGQPGASHLHMFFGNTGINAHSTDESLVAEGGGTCQGNELNRTGYWIPALLDGQDNVRIPKSIVMYYKTWQPGSNVEKYPQGLKMISAKDNAYNASSITWSCYPGSNPGAYSHDPIIPTNCSNSKTLSLSIKFPECWDGRLDSPDHKSHVKAVLETAPCPSSHPRRIPQFSFHAYWDVGDANMANWYVSSDKHNGGTASRGDTVHSDWWGGWNEQTQDAWFDNCIKGPRNCSIGQTGTNRQLSRRAVGEVYPNGVGDGQYPGAQVLDIPAIHH